MTIIVEPDSSGAWLGLAGVILGALIAGLIPWLQGTLQRRRERKAAILRACSELNVASETVMAYAGLLKGIAASATAQGHEETPAAPPLSGDTPLAWAQVMTAAAERVNVASDTINHLAPHELGRVS